MRALCLACLLVLSSACANQNQNQTAAAKVETTVQPEFPLTVSLDEVSRTEHSATVLAHLRRRTAIPVAYTVRLELPAGVRFEAGRPKFEVPPNTAADEVTERYTLLFEQLPTVDATLLVDGDSAGLGSHAKVPYRFGRPAPPEPNVSATGPAGAGKSGTISGPSIPLQR